MIIDSKTTCRKLLTTLTLLLFLFHPFPGYSTEPVPEISISGASPDLLEFDFSNIATGGTYYVEHLPTLSSNEWAGVYSFEGDSGITNWSHMITGTPASAFYRIARDPYHPKVGQSASLNTPGYHDVSGTAHIVNNRTIELRNFHFDGGGVAVEVWLSQTGNFAIDYISISDNLVGTALTNATMVLDIPEGSDLDAINYISIWCVPFSASFGDGSFE